jgi:hypothetical protein
MGRVIGKDLPAKMASECDMTRLISPAQLV